MPLAFVQSGKKVILTRIDAGCDLKNRMASMGIIPGTEIEVVQNLHSGPFMIKVKDSKFAIGRGIALKLQVA